MTSLHSSFLFLIFFLRLHASLTIFLRDSQRIPSLSLRGFDLFFPLPFLFFLLHFRLLSNETSTLSLSLSRRESTFAATFLPSILGVSPLYPGNQGLLFIEPASGRLINGVHGACREIRIYNGAIPGGEGSATTRLRVPASFDPRLVGRPVRFDGMETIVDTNHFEMGENSTMDLLGID